MKNKLFLICPDSKVEHFIRGKYGESHFFATALGAVFKLNHQLYVEELLSLIERETIEELIVVNETSCRFIESVLKKQKGFGTYAELVLIDLLLDNYAYIMENPLEAEQKNRLAELNVQRQVEALLEIAYLRQQVSLQNIVVKGLITSCATGEAKPVNLKSGAFSVWI